jgi:eukaryotic-like serine/threonine-protein kinase
MSRALRPEPPEKLGAAPPPGYVAGRQMSGQTPRKGGRRLHIGLLLAVAVSSWSLAVYFRVKPRATASTSAPLADRAPAPIATDSAAASALAAASSASAAASMPPSATGAPSAEPSALATAASGSPSADAPPPKAAPSTPAQITTCVSALFPKGTFERAPADFSFVCGESRPREAVTRVQAELSRDQWGTGEATMGMREWAVLGWYQLAALSVFRGQCCRSPQPLLWSFKLACPIDKAVEQLEAAVRANDPAAVEAATAEFTRTATCLTRQGQAPNFGQSGLPGPGVGTFRKMLERLH